MTGKNRVPLGATKRLFAAGRITATVAFYIQAAEMPIPPEWAPMLADMRKHAKGGGFGFSIIQAKRGSVPIWIEDINKCATEEELVALILKCISE